MDRRPTLEGVNPLLRQVLPDLGLDEGYAAEHLDLPAGSGLPSALPVSTLACGSVAAAGLAGLSLRGARAGVAGQADGGRVHVDPRQVSVAFRSDQVQSVDGVQESGFAPLSGFFPAQDGWVRTHANYPHHRSRLLRALDLPGTAGRDEAAEAIAQRPAQEIEDVVTADHGIAVRVRTVGEWMASDQARAVATHDVLAVTREDDVAAIPLPDRPRVLDLTRVIAGPVATRTLAFLGCDVLRVDSPHLPELDPQHLDTGAGKRSTLIDLHETHARQRFHELLDSADVLVTGYRPRALEVFGLHPDELARSHPGLVVASLSAWTPSGPWGNRRGFDSIVQAATGVSMIESADGRTPGALPAQALDHATGYLLAAGILAALRNRSVQGGSWRVAAHLARTAHWLLQSDALDAPVETISDVSPWTVSTRTQHGLVVQSRPAFQVGDGPREFAHVGGRWGADPAEWL